MRLTTTFAVLFSTLTLAAAEVPRLIIDTDMCGDYDDVGALAVANALADAGECEILAVMSSTVKSPALGMAQIINDYYGRTELPMGVVKGVGFDGNLTDSGVCAVMQSMVAARRERLRYPVSDAAPDANEVYRKVLAAQPDKSVTLVSIGTMTNIRRLLESDRELVAKKVKAWYTMACCYPTGHEFNTFADAESSAIAFRDSPVPVFVADFNLGEDVRTGLPVGRAGDSSNPVCEAFERCLKVWNEEHLGRSSWDEITVLAAVRPNAFTAKRGVYVIDPKTGDNIWTDDANGNHRALAQKGTKAELARTIDELMMRPVGGLKNIGVWMKAKGDGYAKVYRCDYDAPKPFSIDVTADLWYVLKLDGEIVARARANNAVKSWLYDTFDLPAGRHRVEAVVYHGGPEGYKPLAQETVESAFYCKGLAGWSAADVPRTRFDYGGNTGNAFGAGQPNVACGSSPEYLAIGDDEFLPVEILRKVEPPNIYHHRLPGWRLEKSGLPPHVATVHEVLSAPVTVPAETKTNLVLKLGNYYTAYPVLKVRGGRGAEIRCAWSENAKKLGRGVFFEDTFRADGAEGRFTTSWLRSGTLVDVRVKTAAEPLTVERFAIEESRYPLDTRGYFECDDEEVNGVVKLCRRALEMCAHEGVWDCPFFEQLTYLGDCRVQFLAQNSIGSDDRLQKRCLELFALSRDSDGMMPMNYPCLGPQSLSATYTLVYPIMLGDYLQWHSDREWMKRQLPVLMNVMLGLSRYENADGLLENLPGWCFMDWTTWPGMDPCVGADITAGKLSALENMLYILALDSSSRVFGACGHSRLAAIFAAHAEKARQKVAGLLGTVPKSEHEWALARLTGVAPENWGTVPVSGETKDFPRCSVYFSHYLYEAGGLSPFLKGLELWKGYVKNGYFTSLEMPEPARSDCHGWGAHPLYHLVTKVAGVCPRGAFFEKVEIAPQPGPFKRIRCGVPHAKGMIELDLRFDGEACEGRIVLPEGLDGDFVWRGERMALKAGENMIR